MVEENKELKPRVIKTTVPPKEPTKPNGAVLTAQYNAIMQHVLNIETQLDYIISQPLKPPLKSNPGVKPPIRESAPVGNIEPVKSTPVWQQPDKQPLKTVKEPKKKSGKGLVIFMVVFVALILLAVYLFWSASHGYVFFWANQFK